MPVRCSTSVSMCGFIAQLTNFCSVSGDSLTPGGIPYPCVVKASLGEDTKAVRLVKNQETLHAAIEHALSYSDHVIIERYKIAFVNRPVCSSPDSTRHDLLTCQILPLGIFWATVSRNVGEFYRFIEGREIRCAVLESVKTGKLQALSCMEYDVCKDDIRKTEAKLQLNEKRLPIGKYSSFVCNLTYREWGLHRWVTSGGWKSEL